MYTVIETSLDTFVPLTEAAPLCNVTAVSATGKSMIVALQLKQKGNDLVDLMTKLVGIFHSDKYLVCSGESSKL